jgi:hypothetical protein
MKGNRFRYIQVVLLAMLYVLAIFGLASSTAASADLIWQKCLGGSAWDYAESIQQTTDDGYIVAGRTASNNGNVTDNHGNWDYWVVKLDGLGNIVWQKCLGGSNGDYAYSVQQTADGGYIVAGTTESSLTGNVGSNHGGFDYWVVKLDGLGNIVWQKCLGGSATDSAYSVQQTADGGYVVAGFTYSSLTGEVGSNHGVSDFWIVKLNGLGNIVWQKCLGGSSFDEAYSVQQTADGGYIIAGYTWSNNGNVSGNHGVSYDYWVVKLDGLGNIVWQKCLGGSSYDWAESIQQTTDGGYIVAGRTYSSLTGDVGSNHGDWDYWIVKLDGLGNIVWQKCLGGSSTDYAYSIQQTADGRYIVAGYTSSNDGNVTNGGYHGANDYWVVKLDGLGNIIWQKCLGGSSTDSAYGVQQTADGGYIVAGSTNSNDGNVSGKHALDDFWVVKLGERGEFDTRFMDSYEDLLRLQFGLIGSFENLLKNTTLNSTRSYTFLDSFDDLADRQQSGLYSFEDLVSSRWSELNVSQKIKLTDSYEDLLRRQAVIITSNEDLLKRAFCKLTTEDKKQLLDRFEDRLKFEVELLKKFEDWLHYQQMIEEKEYDAWIAFLSSFEDLIRRQSDLMDSFELMMKIDCTKTYLTLNKSAIPASVNAGDDMTYNYTINATGIYDIKKIVVKDSLWGEVGQKELLNSKENYTLSITKNLTCADCNNCQCKVCNSATACGEVITPNGNFTVCVVNDAPYSDKCVIVSENFGVSPIYPGKKVTEATAAQVPAAEEAQTEAMGNVTAEVKESTKERSSSASGCSTCSKK